MADAALAGLAALVLLIPLILYFIFIRYVPNYQVGVVEMKWSAKGSLAYGIIALNGEAGYQPKVVRGGFHWLPRYQYTLHKMPLVTIPQNNMGYVFARDGKPLEPQQVLASNETAIDFTRVENFLMNGGQRGPQRQLLREGTYAVNLAQFAVITAEKVYFLAMNRDEEAVFKRMAELIRERDGFSPVVIKGPKGGLGNKVTTAVSPSSDANHSSFSTIEAPAPEPPQPPAPPAPSPAPAPPVPGAGKPAPATAAAAKAAAAKAALKAAGGKKAAAKAATAKAKNTANPPVEEVPSSEDVIGVVTVQEGPSLPQGDIISPIVGDDPNNEQTYHDNFQDPERFFVAGGCRGRQLQVLTEGTYYINRLFATLEIIPKTVIEVGYVGVVISYTGKISADLSGEDYKHGELVEPGCRGVWKEPLLPGKYAFNTFAGKIIQVPTTNIILKWNRNESGAHKFDENLAEVTLITKDAFEPSLPLSVVMHIDYRQAPLVIQRFGDLRKLVEQTLDPMIGAYFKNIGQIRTLIELLQERAEIQDTASNEMQIKFRRYNLELEEVLIGTPKSNQDSQIEQILSQLRDRQVATEQIETYASQEAAATKERELREAESRAKQQAVITQSELSIQIQSNEGKAQYQRAVQQAAQIRALAEAEATKIKLIAEADAEKAARIGVAQAVAIEEQVLAYGGPRFQLTQQVMSRFSEAIQEARVDVCPKIVMGGNGNSGSVLESLLSLLMNDKMQDQIEPQRAEKVGSDAVEKMRAEIRAALMGEGKKSK